MLRRRADETVSLRDLLAASLPIALLIGAVLWAAYHFVRPLPPDTIVMSTGAPDGAYHAFALRYQAVLKTHGVKLELRPSQGALENLQRLRDPHGDIDVGFVQTGLAEPDAESNLLSLGSMFYEPVWVFYRSESTFDRMIQLVTRRVAIGAEGSGTQRIARQLFEANGLSDDMLVTVPIGGDAAANELIAGKLDAAILVSAPEALVIQKLVNNPNIKLMSFAIAEAYTRKFPFLTSLTLPQGAMDLVHEYPRSDTQLFATTATLVARGDFHPALASLLLQAASEVHSGAGPFNRVREFPAPRDGDFPLSPEAQRYYKSGTPFLQRYLPFWIAVFVDRLLFMLLPVLAVALPLVRVMPALYAWRVRRRVYRLYGELKFLEEDVRESPDTADFSRYFQRLDNIEDRANRRPLPLAFQHEVYTLREHIQLVRRALERRVQALNPTSEGQPKS